VIVEVKGRTLLVDRFASMFDAVAVA